jgi:aminopeptidase-like protein
MMNVLAYSDGTRDLADIARQIDLNPTEAISIAEQLAQKGLLSRI